MKNVIDTAIDDTKLKIAKHLKALGIANDIISKSTGLSPNEITML
ncbi:MAG: hypothetical protein ACKVOU_08885 [Cytophagales bacterium]